MSRSVNKVSLIGNVGQDPEVRATASGSRVAKLSLATSWTKPGTDKENTDWHRLTFFGKLADVVEAWVKKGDRIFVEGRIQYSTTTDQGGNTRYWTDIIVGDLVMLGSRDTRALEPVPNREQPSGALGPDEEMPF